MRSKATAPTLSSLVIMVTNYPNGLHDAFGAHRVRARIKERHTPTAIYRYLSFRDGQTVRNLYLGSVRKKGGGHG